MKRRKVNIKRVKKFLKNNVKYILTTFIAIISIIISIISLNSNIIENKKKLYPNIYLKSVDNTIFLQKGKDYYYSYYYKNEINTKMKIVNIGDGVAKNLKFTWSEENSEKLKSLIKLMDKNNIVNIKEEYPFINVEMPGSGGAINISKKNYSKKIDYLLSEKDSISEDVLIVPIEYINYFQIISFLSLQYNYDINKIMNGIVLYIDLEYSDVDNNLYEKTIQLRVDFNKEKYNNRYFYYFNLGIVL